MPPSRSKKNVQEGEDIKVTDEVKLFIAGEVCKLGLKDPTNGEYVIGRHMSQALRNLITIFVENVTDEYRSQLIHHFLSEKVVDRHLLPLLGSLNLPEDGKEAEMALSLVKGLVTAGEGVSSGEIVRMVRGLKRPFAKSMGALLNVVMRICLNEDYSDEQVKARSIFLIPDHPYYLRNLEGADDRIARNSHLLKSMQKSNFLEFLIAATNDQENALICGRKRELLHLWAAIFSGIDADQPVSSLLGEADRVVKKPIRHGRFSGAVIVQLATGQEVVLQSTSQLLETDTSEHLDKDKKVGRKPPRLEYLPNYTLLSQAELQYYQSVVSYMALNLKGLVDSFVKATEKLETDEHFHNSVFSLFSFLLRFAPEPQSVLVLLQPEISQRAGFLLHKWLPQKESTIPCLNICFYLSAALDMLELLKGSSESDYLSVAERNLCSQYDLMRGVSVLFTGIKSPAPTTLKKLAVISSSVIRGMQRYCEGKAMLYVSQRRLRKQHEEEEEDEYEDFYKEINYSDFEEGFFTAVMTERLISLLGVKMEDREQLALADLLKRVGMVRPELLYRLRYMAKVQEALRSRVFVKELDQALLKVLSTIMDACSHNLDYLFLLFGALKFASKPKSTVIVEKEEEGFIEDPVEDNLDLETIVRGLQEREQTSIALWILEKLEQGVVRSTSTLSKEDQSMDLFNDEADQASVKVSILADIDSRKKQLKAALVRKFMEAMELREVDGVYSLNLSKDQIGRYQELLAHARELFREGTSTYDFSQLSPSADANDEYVEDSAVDMSDVSASSVEEMGEEDRGEAAFKALEKYKRVRFLQKRARVESDDSEGDVPTKEVLVEEKENIHLDFQDQ